MKNIHLISTDNYSQLVNSTSKYGGLFLSKYYSPMKDMGDSYQNIYITNSEEIKEGDYVVQINFEKTNTQVIKCETEFQTEIANDKDGSYTKNKIILTTDQDLIKDGVQAIDDIFLEWFVKNPSCEDVEIEYCNPLSFVKGKPYTAYNYKIIIPQEEPKRKIDSCRYFNLEIGCVKDICKCEQEEPKQETEQINVGGGSGSLPMYDVEELNEIIKLFNDKEIDLYTCIGRVWNKAYFIGAKEMAERMYSDEEVLELLLKSKIETSNLYYEDMKEWFEQFKKK